MSPPHIVSKFPWSKDLMLEIIFFDVRGIWMDFKGQQHLNLFSRHQIYVKIPELSSLHWIQISLLIQTYLHVLQWKGTNSILDGQSFVERVKYKTNCVQKSYGIKAKRP